MSQVMNFFNIFWLLSEFIRDQKIDNDYPRKNPKKYSRVEKLSFFEYLFRPLKKHRISFKIGQDESPESENFFLGYFDMADSVLILPDSLDSVFKSFLRISCPKKFTKIAYFTIKKGPIDPLKRAFLTPWKGVMNRHPFL